MLRWALIFLMLCIVSAVFGFTGVAKGAASTAKISFFVTGIVFLIFLAVGLAIEKREPEKL